MYVKNEHMRRNDTLKIVFMGTPSYATTILKALMADDQIEVSLVITQEDKPVGRKQLLTPPHIKAWLQEAQSSIEVYQPKSLRTLEAVEKIASCKPDFIVVAAYGKLLPKAILDIAPCINLHASLLPKYRGASPIQSTLLEGEAYAGVTSMLMEEGLDTGAMLGFCFHRVEKNETSGVLFETLAGHAADLTRMTLKHFDALDPLAQKSCDATHCKKIKKEEGEVTFEQSAQSIMRRFRGLTPWPGVFLSSGLKLLALEEREDTHNTAIGVITSIEKEGVVLTCKEGALLIKRVQPVSKNAMHACDYIRGQRMGIGDSLA